MSFPNCYAPLRTDEGFRNRIDPAHHKTLEITPLETLPEFDIVNGIITADELHLLHLGVMKRLLHAWVMPKRSTVHKWTRDQTDMVNKFLETIKLPSEIHRAMRTLSSVKIWKGLEYRNFLMYTGIVALLNVYDASNATFKMFACLFTGTIICSSKQFNDILEIAEQCYQKFVQHYKDICRFGK